MGPGGPPGLQNRARGELLSSLVGSIPTRSRHLLLLPRATVGLHRIHRQLLLAATYAPDSSSFRNLL